MGYLKQDIYKYASHSINIKENKSHLGKSKKSTKTSKKINYE